MQQKPGEGRVKPSFLFLIILIIDATYSFINFILYCENCGNFAFLFLHLIPLLALIFISQKIPKIENSKKLSRIKTGLIVYLSADILFGLIAYNFWIPMYIRVLFYSKNWCYNFLYTIFYQMHHLAFNLILNIFYWISYVFLLKDISSRIHSIPTTDLQPSESEDTNKISSTFKISIVCIVVLIFQTILNSFIVTAFEDNQNDTGEHAIGMAFVALILIVGKFILSFPTILLSTIGIVKGSQKKNKGKRLNQNGFIINIACLVISELQVFFWW